MAVDFLAWVFAAGLFLGITVTAFVRTLAFPSPPNPDYHEAVNQQLSEPRPPGSWLP